MVYTFLNYKHNRSRLERTMPVTGSVKQTRTVSLEDTITIWQGLLFMDIGLRPDPTRQKATTRLRFLGR